MAIPFPPQYPYLENSMDRGVWHSPQGHKESNMTEQLMLQEVKVHVKLTNQYKTKQTNKKTNKKVKTLKTESVNSKCEHR